MMVSLRRRRKALGREEEYATAEEFCRIFAEDMNSLYWLSLLLTGDEHRAEQCFAAGLEECVDGNAVFKEWARSWSKRVVIKQAIRLMAPRPGMLNGPGGVKGEEGPWSRARAALEAFDPLHPFDRFIFVMSVLEGYSDHECSAMLRSAPADVVEARIRALQGLRKIGVPSCNLLETQGSEHQRVFACRPWPWSQVMAKT